MKLQAEIEGKLNLTKCALCGVRSRRIPMYSTTFASICLGCVSGFSRRYMASIQDRRALEQARVLGYPLSRWRRFYENHETGESDDYS